MLQQIQSINKDTPLGWAQDSGEHLYGGCFTGSVGPEKTINLSGRHHQAYVVHRSDLFEAFCKFFQANHGLPSEECPFSVIESQAASGPVGACSHIGYRASVERTIFIHSL